MLTVTIWFVIWGLGAIANAFYFTDYLGRKLWMRNLPEHVADVMLLVSVPLSWLVPAYLLASRVREYDRL